jgi:hypothetical protein
MKREKTVGAKDINCTLNISLAAFEALIDFDESLTSSKATAACIQLETNDFHECNARRANSKFLDIYIDSAISVNACS